jgi:hypothetical protein
MREDPSKKETVSGPLVFDEIWLVWPRQNVVKRTVPETKKRVFKICG